MMPPAPPLSSRKVLGRFLGSYIQHSRKIIGPVSMYSILMFFKAFASAYQKATDTRFDRFEYKVVSGVGPMGKLRTNK